jgi:pectin methylesterase-like acyl-CoA thioesterase
LLIIGRGESLAVHWSEKLFAADNLATAVHNVYQATKQRNQQLVLATATELTSTSRQLVQSYQESLTKRLARFENSAASELSYPQVAGVSREWGEVATAESIAPVGFFTRVKNSFQEEMGSISDKLAAWQDGLAVNQEKFSAAWDNFLTANRETIGEISNRLARGGKLLAQNSFAKFNSQLAKINFYATNVYNQITTTGATNNIDSIEPYYLRLVGDFYNQIGQVAYSTSWAGTNVVVLQGEPGERGIQGERGEQGIQGEKGEQGIQGEPGEPGESVSAEEVAAILANNNTWSGTNIYEQHVITTTINTTEIASAANFSSQNLYVDNEAFIGTGDSQDVLVVKANSTFNGTVDVNGTFTASSFATPYQQVVTVAKSGGDYTTVKAALAAITDNSSTKRYLVQVMPGNYQEDNPLTLKEYVDIKAASADWRDTVIYNLNDADLITAANNSSLSGFTLEVSGTTGSARSVVAAGDKSFLLLDNKISYSGTTAGYGISVTTGEVSIEGGEMSGSGLARGISLTGAGTVNLWNAKVVSLTDDIYAAAGTVNLYYNRLQGSGDNLEIAAGATVNSSYDQIDSTKVTSAGTFYRQDQPANTLVVAKGEAGHYDTITEALAEITNRGDASATNYYTIEVLPGVYSETVALQQYVDIVAIGGSAATTITQVDNTVITGSSNSTLRGFTLSLTGDTTGKAVVAVGTSSPKLEDLVITGTSGVSTGISVTTGSPTVSSVNVSSVAIGLTQTGSGNARLERSSLTAGTTDVAVSAGTVNSYYNVLAGAGNLDVALGAVLNSGGDILDSSKIVNSGTFTRLDKPQNTIYGAKGSDGHYDTISEALAAITNATSSNLYTIKVFPGVYSESVTMKDYVDIVAVGDSNSTVITQVDNTVITGSSNSTLRGFTLSLTGDTTGKAVVAVGTSSPKLEDLVITGTSGVSTGISVTTGSPVIELATISNVLDGLHHSGASGLSTLRNSTITSSGNDIKISTSGGSVYSYFNRLAGSSNHYQTVVGTTLTAMADTTSTLTESIAAGTSASDYLRNGNIIPLESELYDLGQPHIAGEIFILQV